MLRKLNILLYAALIVGVFLSGCFVNTFETADTPSTETENISTSVTEGTTGSRKVSDINSFLAALDSNTIIELSEGIYRLDQALDYGKDSDNPAYYWEPVGDGYQLVLNHLHDLIIVGANQENTSLLTAPRFANVISMENCKRIHMEGLTVGHTDAGELCSGGVIQLLDCINTDFRSMGLFGCGIWGFELQRCSDIIIDRCSIYECSYSGVYAQDSGDLRISDSDFYTLGTPENPAMSVITLDSCQNTVIEDCSITENNLMQLLYFNHSDNVYMKDSEIRANKIVAYGFQFMDSQPVFDHIDLNGNDLRRWYEIRSMMALYPDNTLIGNDQLPPVTIVSDEDLPKQKEFVVSTADEFLNAIGPDHKIILNTEKLDLSTASDYGTGSSPFYHWEENYDGPGLVIENLDNLSIEGENMEKHTILSVPRYANVLSFRNCRNLKLSGFTAGHTEAPGECSGGVLDFRDCSKASVSKCGLFGCGILGVQAQFSSDIAVTQCDIYDCSFGGIQMWNIDGIRIAENTYRNLGGINVSLENCEKIQCDIPFNDYPEN